MLYIFISLIIHGNSEYLRLYVENIEYQKIDLFFTGGVMYYENR
jgi:hypothetical protein